MQKEIVKFWSIFLGVVSGFVVAKIYQIWAILYRMEGMIFAGVDSYYNTPLWVFATEKPSVFLVVTVMLFAWIGFFTGKVFHKE